jgi:multiple sugar transport system permease protein
MVQIYGNLSWLHISAPESKIMLKRILGSSQKRNEILSGYLMIAPEVIGLVIFLFIPIIYAVFISLYDWNALSTKIFVGLSNYKKMIKDMTFINSVITTSKYAVFYVVPVFVLSLINAVFINALRGNWQQASRVALYFPTTVSTIVASTVWTFLFNSRNGYINEWLSYFGIGRQLFLGSVDQALFCVAVVGIWVVVGFDTVIFLSALKDVPSSYYEAAKLDGASSLQIFGRITFPLIKGTSIFILITTLISSFQVFDQIRVMTSGGPGTSTKVTVYYIFELAFEQYRFGYASTIAVTLSVIIMILTVFQLKLYKFNA